jgi:hypothetical protein
MIIHDKHGHQHHVTLGSTVWLDRHLVTRTVRTHNTLILHGFTIPHEIRRRAIGSTLLHALERHYAPLGVVHIQIVAPRDVDPNTAHFFARNGYRQSAGKFDKHLTPHA